MKITIESDNYNSPITLRFSFSTIKKASSPKCAGPTLQGWALGTPLQAHNNRGLNGCRRPSKKLRPKYRIDCIRVTLNLLHIYHCVYIALKLISLLQIIRGNRRWFWLFYLLFYYYNTTLQHYFYNTTFKLYKFEVWQ